MRTRARAISSLAAGVMAVSLMPSAANAATRLVSDTVGDTNAPNDVTQMTVQNGERRLIIDVRYRNLGPGHISARVEIDTGQRRGELYLFSRSQNFDGRWVNHLYHYRPSNQQYQIVRCPGRRVTYQPGSNSRILFDLPQRCLGADAGPALFQYFGAEHEGTGPPRPEVAPEHPFLVARN